MLTTHDLKPPVVNPQQDIAEVIKQAAVWLSKIHQGPLSSAEEAELEKWRQQSELHETTWKKAASISGKFQAIPNDIGMSVLGRPESIDRREFMKPLAVLMIALPVGAVSYRYLPWQSWTADYTTAIGETRSFQMAGGSDITLNTNTSLDIDYTVQERVIKLHSGEIYIETARDIQNRPFYVFTRHGRLQALGTKFIVRVDHDASYIGVTEGAVEIMPAGNEQVPLVIQAGQETTFTKSFTRAASAMNPNAVSWVDGVLYADDMPLKDFIELLGRYRRGVLNCDKTAEDVRISGAFLLQDTDKILETIQSTRPLKIEWRTRYWGTFHRTRS
jgi:transmembrane sensor